MRVSGCYNLTFSTSLILQWTWKLYLWAYGLLWMLSWPHSLGLLTVFSFSLPCSWFCLHPQSCLFIICLNLSCVTTPIHYLFFLSYALTSPFSLLSFHLPCLRPLPVVSLLPPCLFSAVMHWPLRAINRWSVPPLLNPVWRGSWQADKYHQQVGLRLWWSLFSSLFLYFIFRVWVIFKKTY